MDICDKCNRMLRVGRSYYTFENDTTPDLPTKAFVNLEMLCINEECVNFAGADLDNPKWVVDTVTNGVN
jgi:hypothetical protein